jgi:hypothetical protein
MIERAQKIGPGMDFVDLLRRIALQKYTIKPLKFNKIKTRN